MKNYVITKDLVVEGRFKLEFLTPNRKGEIMTVTFDTCRHDLKCRNSLMCLWVKYGYIDRALPTYWAIDTDVYDAEGRCRRAYDPTIIDYKKINRKDNKTVGSRFIINFDYLTEATPENMQLLINEIENRFYNCIPTETQTEYI